MCNQPSHVKCAHPFHCVKPKELQEVLRALEETDVFQAGWRVDKISSAVRLAQSIIKTWSSLWRNSFWGLLSHSTGPIPLYNSPALVKHKKTKVLMLNVNLIFRLNVCKVNPWKPDGSTPSKQEIWIVLISKTTF